MVFGTRPSAGSEVSSHGWVPAGGETVLGGRASPIVVTPGGLSSGTPVRPPPPSDEAPRQRRGREAPVPLAGSAGGRTHPRTLCTLVRHSGHLRGLRNLRVSRSSKPRTRRNTRGQTRSAEVAGRSRATTLSGPSGETSEPARVALSTGARGSPHGSGRPQPSPLSSCFHAGRRCPPGRELSHRKRASRIVRTILFGQHHNSEAGAQQVTGWSKCGSDEMQS